jgi:hypothetical protein
MAILDLSAVFDFVNIELLFKRLIIIGLPSDVVNLIRVWLMDRKFYVEVNGQFKHWDSSRICTRSFLYAIYVSPLFDLTRATNFVDDNFIVVWNKIVGNLVNDMEKELEMITKWLKDSGLQVYMSKREICLFHRNDKPPITIKVMTNNITTKNQ